MWLFAYKRVWLFTQRVWLLAYRLVSRGASTEDLIKHSNIHIHDRCVKDLLEADRAQPTEYRWSRASDWGEALGLALNQARAVLLAKQFRKPGSRLISGQIGIVFKSYCQYQYRHLGIYYYRSCLLRAIQ